MAHRDFDASRRAYHVERDPVTFTLGGETFEVLLDPSLGDTFDLYDAPEVRYNDDGTVAYDAGRQDDLQLVRVLTRFLERALPLEQRPTFQRALYRIPAAQAGVIIEAAMWIVEQVTAFPTGPPASSSRGRAKRGAGSRTNSAGSSRSS
jgi:hypothetical protein